MYCKIEIVKFFLPSFQAQTLNRSKRTRLVHFIIVQRSQINCLFITCKTQNFFYEPCIKFSNSEQILEPLTWKTLCHNRETNPSENFICIVRTGYKAEQLCERISTWVGNLTYFGAWKQIIENKIIYVHVHICSIKCCPKFLNTVLSPNYLLYINIWIDTCTVIFHIFYQYNANAKSVHSIYS